MTESLFDIDPKVHDFIRTMPEGYREVFDRRAVREHADIVAARGDRPGHAALWRTLPRGLAVLCVVADDQPGLLSVVTTALALHRLDVVTAHVFSRMRDDGTTEAVDYFWVQDRQRVLGQPPAQEHLERCVATLCGFLRAGVEPDDITAGSLSVPPPGEPPKVSWAGDSAGGDAVLQIEATDGPGLLLSAAKAMYASGLTIVASQIATEGDIARNRFALRLADGKPLDPGRKDAVLCRVREALLAWHGRARLRSTG
jgi:UTP:GlnB (protein PII) uridylyltransferase